MTKYIWSNRYGRNPREGLHVWLEKNVKGYKRNDLQLWTVAFAKHLGNDKNSTNYATSHFDEFRQFVAEVNYKLPVRAVKAVAPTCP